MPSSEHLFSYGTLQNKNVQLTTFGRELTGRPDALPGYVRKMGAAADPRIAALTGESTYQDVQPSPNPRDAVPGIVFEITEPELAIADRYEEDAGYRRVKVTLSSGVEAWLYRVAP